MHYSRIAMVLEKAQDPDTLSNRVVHVSVQLFSNEELAVRMTENLSLLQVMVVSLKNMMSRILIALPLNSMCNLSELSVFNSKIYNTSIQMFDLQLEIHLIIIERDPALLIAV